MSHVQLFSFVFICFTCFGKLSSCEECENEVQMLKSRIEELEKVVHVLNETTIKRNERDTRSSAVQKRAVHVVNVAFSATLSSSRTQLNIGETIKFDNILLNDGKGYSKDSGIFVAPQSGVYLFAYIFCHTNPTAAVGQTWLQLMYNDKPINAGVADSRHSWQDIQGSNVAVIRLNTSDSVWVQNVFANGATLYTFGNSTTFSGFLLYV